ncbi:MAG: STAS domain-containing protein [Magnetococcales bacterium]|nr:STAS domain-containing protein [Magnetococcales bacterium]
MIKITESDNVILVSLPEEFSYRIYQEFRGVYLDRPVGVRYDIDFSQVVSMDSSALGMLLLMHEHCKSHRCRIRLLHCNSRVAGILSYSSVGSLFELC